VPAGGITVIGSFAFHAFDLAKILSGKALSMRYCNICCYRPEQDAVRIEAGFGWDRDILENVIPHADESSSNVAHS
jgi:hypothetical protein